MGFTEEMKKALKGSGAVPNIRSCISQTGPPLWPAYATIDNWCVLSGMGRRVTYDEIGRGNLKAIKVGARTLIDVAAGLVWLRSRPAAVIRAPRQRNTEAA